MGLLDDIRVFLTNATTSLESLDQLIEQHISVDTAGTGPLHEIQEEIDSHRRIAEESLATRLTAHLGELDTALNSAKEALWAMADNAASTAIVISADRAGISSDMPIG